jgi:hypothetical protein
VHRSHCDLGVCCCLRTHDQASRELRAWNSHLSPRQDPSFCGRDACTQFAVKFCALKTEQAHLWNSPVQRQRHWLQQDGAYVQAILNMQAIQFGTRSRTLAQHIRRVSQRDMQARHDHRLQIKSPSRPPGQRLPPRGLVPSLLMQLMAASIQPASTNGLLIVM